MSIQRIGARFITVPSTLGKFRVNISNGAVFVEEATGGGTTSHTITPSGGFTLAGAVTSPDGRVFTPVGGLSLSGTVPGIYGRTFVPAGGIDFGGSIEMLHGHIFDPAGGVQFGGTAPFTSHTASTTFIPSGGIQFGGAAGIIRTGGTPVSQSSVFRLRRSALRHVGNYPQ